MILLGLFGIILGLSAILAYDITVTIDKKLQKLIIKRNSIIKRFDCIKEIPFYEIFEFRKFRIGDENGDTWSITMATLSGKDIAIYSDTDKPNFEKVVDKIIKITDNKFPVRIV